MAKTLRLGARLHYPITISKIIKNPGDLVKKQEGILQYTFKFERRIGDPELGNERISIETGVADFDCPTEGKLVKWLVKVGDVIQRDQDLVSIDEQCAHDIQYFGLCGKCGKDMTEANWAAETLDTQRATVAMVHDDTALMVSRSQAVRAENSLQRRLLKDRKLSLVVDLDQTIIHACIEPTIGEWQADPTNPNHEAVKDVRKFQLDDGPRGLASGCWYYIKMRPGLAEFLEKVSEMFEMHIYTMGTRAYALNIAKIVDPTKKLFGNRIISRDENGSMTAKTLERLFPVSTSMVVVIDDRADVWPQNRPNLIKVTPYDFFKGIGDINSSFLPKREDIISAGPPPETRPGIGAEAAVAADPSTGVLQPQDGAAAAEKQNALLQLQAEEQERALEKQLTDRPLLQLQEKLDKEDEEAGKESVGGAENSEPTTNGDAEHPTAHQRHNLLRDDDQELQYLENHLTTLHHSFYEQYDARSTNQPLPDEVAADAIPDVGLTLNFLKSQVLRGTRIVLSGLVPLGTDVRRSEIGLQAESFGTEIHTRVSEDVTHLVINSARQRTHKVRQAARIPSIKIVNQDWLANSLAQWKKLDERPYLVDVHPSDRRATTPLEEGEEGPKTPRPRPRIMIVRSGRHPPPLENGEDDGDDGDEEYESGREYGEDDPDAEDEDGEIEDRYNVMPPELEDGARSPVEGLKRMQWDDVDKELEEFMGSEIDDSDMDGTDRGFDTDRDEEQQFKGLKRKYGEDTEDEDGESSNTEGGSALAKKQRRAKARTTGLRNVRNATEEGDNAEGGEDGSGLPTPMVTGDENGAGDEGEEKDDEEARDDDEDDGFSDLEAELEAELQAEMDTG
ncbi:hypothetical protein DL764_004196 [Monosporascus ibericus]|uniref:RNA polymerase II subunit A C-terminal domain phosphatase n=1 Tax=Monosporascus ibericus TaxID=155417 RepID=A0A4Q4THS8_9PEZI|nr:hypothetical protein DL764_004196 [Monosporascus ibericus]